MNSAPNQSDDSMLVTMRVSDFRKMVREECAAVVQEALDPVRQKWVDIEAVAAHTGMATKTIRRWITAGMPATQVGHTLRFRLGEVDAWIAQHRAKSKR